MQKVRAKFRVSSVENFGWSKTVKANAIHGTEGENGQFTKATPSGQLGITIDKDTEAFDFFAPGDEFYLDMTKCTPPAPAES